MAETGSELTLDQKLRQFKSLLEYFVAHLEWEATQDRSIEGFKDYIEPNLGPDGKYPVGYRQGRGDHNGKLQQWIRSWESFGSEAEPYYKVAIALNCHGQAANKCNSCYLNWWGTGHNIKPCWEPEHRQRVVALYTCVHYKDGHDDQKTDPVTIDQLELYKGSEPNESLKSFWLQFEKLYLAWNPGMVQGTTAATAELSMELKPMFELLKSNHNLILTGAPGTGKTYLAKQLAQRLVEADRSGDQKLTDAEVKAHIKLVQFHPSYDYTDFVEGLRPVTLNGQPSFEHRDGTFKKLCKAALQQPNDNFVLIIDEINRGEVSKIFGELFFAIDPDYRGADEGVVETQYQNLIEEGDPFAQGFYVPENVYVIGTMNDIDRSVESIDFAFRRRFAWHEVDAASRFHMLAEIEPFKSAPKFVQQVEAYFTALNYAIEQEALLGVAYQVGPAYFLKLKNFVGKANLNEASEDFVAEKMEQLWDNHLEPLLKEYVRGNSDESAILERLETAFFAHGEKQSSSEL